MEETYLVTGATGFVGSCIVRKLVNNHKKVIIITRNKKLSWRLADISHKIQIYELNLLDKSLEEVINIINPTYIFHLAAYGSLPQQGDFSEMVDVNLKSTARLIDVLKNKPFKLFVNTGSSSEYGIKDHPIEENESLKPYNDYGVTKAAATLYCQEIAERHKLPFVALRLFSPYGYYEDRDRLMPYIIRTALKNEEIKVSSPNYVRDFVFIEDVVNAYLLTTSAKITPGDILNIGSGCQQSVGDVVKMVLQQTSSSSKVVWGSKAKQQRNLEPQKWEANIQKAKSVLGWTPRTSIEEGIKKTIDWFRHNQYYYE